MLFNNRYLDALAKLMLFSAALHMFILFWFSFVRKDASILNYFRILNIDYLFPDFPFNGLSSMISVLIIASLYLLFLRDGGGGK